MIKYYHRLIYLLPIALVSGPFVPDSIVVVCALLFLIDTFRNKLFCYYDNSFFKIFLLFFFLINLSALLSGDLMPLKYSLGYLRYGIFSVFVFYVLKNFKNAKLYFSYSIIAVFLFLIIDGFIQFTFGKNIFLFELNRYGNSLPYVTSVFAEEKKLGSYMARLFPLLLMSLFVINEKFEQKNLDKINVLFIFLIIFTVASTTERVSFFILMVYIFYIFFKSKNFIKSKSIIYLIFITSLLLMFYFNPLLFHKFKSILYSSGLSHPGYTEPGKVMGGYDIGFYIFSKFHHEQIINCIEIFKNNVFFGVGAKNYKNITGLTHPHNFHAQILAESGLFAYVVVLSVFSFLFYKVNKLMFFRNSLSKNEEIKFILILSFWVSLIPIPSGDFFNNWLNIIMYLPVGFYLYLDDKKI